MMSEGFITKATTHRYEVPEQVAPDEIVSHEDDPQPPRTFDFLPQNPILAEVSLSCLNNNNNTFTWCGPSGVSDCIGQGP
jgi:hypothetical protein